MSNVFFKMKNRNVNFRNFYTDSHDISQYERRRGTLDLEVKSTNLSTVAGILPFEYNVSSLYKTKKNKKKYY